MPVNLKGRNFLKELDFTPEEFKFLLWLSKELKAAKYAGYEQPRMTGKNIALIFEKTSTRTRCAFEVAAYDQGAHVTYLGPEGSQIGQKESMKDTARVLGRMFDAIEYRGKAQAVVEVLGQYAGVPVYNGLTDEFHPTQMLADILTMMEHSDKPLSQITYAYMGDGRFNMARSYLVTGALLGMDVRIVAPKHLWPDEALIRRGEGRGAEDRRARATHRRCGRGREGRGLPADRCVGVDGRTGRCVGRAHQAAEAVSSERASDETDGQSQRQVHALPARVPQSRHRYGRGRIPEVRRGQPGSDRGSLRVAGLDRV